MASDLMRGTGRFNLAQGLVVPWPASAPAWATSALASSLNISATDRVSVSSRYRSCGPRLFCDADARDEREQRDAPEKQKASFAFMTGLTSTEASVLYQFSRFCS
jgi:hypothetical protein